MARKRIIKDFVPAAATALLIETSSGRGRKRLPRPICARDGCLSEVSRRANTYCSPRCRNQALAPGISAERRARRVAKGETVVETSPELREAFRLRFAGVPAAEWPEESRRQYNDYHKTRRSPKEPKPGTDPVLQRAFGLLSRHVKAAEWPDEERLVYNAYLRERRRRAAETLNDTLPSRLGEREASELPGAYTGMRAP